MFKWISNLFKSLNANTNPAEIAHALKNANIPTNPSNDSEKSTGNNSAGSMLKGLLKK